MRRRLAWRYYCDHCKKANCSGAAIRRHEERCCKNPDRYCGMCHTQWPRPELMGEAAAIKRELPTVDDILAWDYSPRPGAEAQVSALLDRLTEAADGCPTCMLAAIIQGGLEAKALGFDYEAAKREWRSNLPDRDYESSVYTLGTWSDL